MPCCSTCTCRASTLWSGETVTTGATVAVLIGFATGISREFRSRLAGDRRSADASNQGAARALGSPPPRNYNPPPHGPGVAANSLQKDGTVQQTALKLGLLVSLVLPLAACSPSVRMPRLHNPGPAGLQRYEATAGADPYPLPDVGPEIEGGRPREFQQPMPEVERARQYYEQRSVPQYTVPVAPPVYPGYPVQ